jgi:hypothetical protein
MNDKMQDLLKKAREERFFFPYERVIRAMIAEDYSDLGVIESVFLEFIAAIKNGEQRSEAKKYAKSLIKDKVVLKRINDAIKIK